MRLSKLTLAVGLVAVLFLAPACGASDRGIGVIHLVGNSKMSFGYATFLERPSTSCTTSKAGGCEVQECLNDGAPVKFASAGLLKVSGGRLDGGVTFVGADPACFPGCNAYAGTLTPAEPYWVGGETLTAFATGAHVPGFSATVTAPNPIKVTAPVCDVVGCSLSRTSDLEVSWSGGAGTSVLASLRSNSLAGSVTIDCRFAASPGTIGAAAMAKLGAADAGYTNSLWIQGSNRTTFAAGDYDIAFEANNLELMNFVTLSN